MKLNKWLLVAGALGLGLRIALALSIKPVLASDSLEYHQYSENLVKEHRYYIIYMGRQAHLRGHIFYSFRPPGYPFLVATIYKLTGIRPRVVSLVQAFMDFCSSIFIFLLARNWLKPRNAFWAFSAAQAHFLYVPMLLSETLFLFLFTFSLWIFCSRRTDKWLWMILNGLCWGWLILTKPEKVIFVPLLSGYFIWKNYSRNGLFKGLAWLAIMSAVIAPWLWREKQVHGQWVWISSRGGRTFFEGNYLPIEMSKVYATAQKAKLDELEMDRLFYKVSFEYLKAHPLQYFKAGIKRAYLLFDLRTTNWLAQTLFLPMLGSGTWPRQILTYISLMVFNFYRLVIICGVAGAILSWRRLRELALIYAIPVLLVIFHFAVFIGASRYLVPAFPSICIFFALLIEKIVSRFRPASMPQNGLAGYE